MSEDNLGIVGTALPALLPEGGPVSPRSPSFGVTSSLAEPEALDALDALESP